jgi:hypothetical protein
MWTKVIACAGIVLGAGAAAAAPLQFGDMEFEGLAWETGGTAASVPGDTLVMVGVVTALQDSDFWGVDLVANELTVRFSDLVVEEVVTRSGWWYVRYSQGHIDLWLDPTRDHDYGVDPPNATVPATFTNGTLWLSGSVQYFGIVYSDGSPFGSLGGNVWFTGGTAIDLAQQWALWGSPVLSGTVHPAGATEPQGYDLRTTAYLYPVIDGVERSSWGAVKELYRVR